jgi:hypothetical protein
MPMAAPASSSASGTAAQFCTRNALRVRPLRIERPSAELLRSPLASISDDLYGGIVTQDLVVTLTGYRKGKVSGTIAGTFTPSAPGTATPIQANVSFAAKCSTE